MNILKISLLIFCFEISKGSETFECYNCTNCFRFNENTPKCTTNIRNGCIVMGVKSPLPKIIRTCLINELNMEPCSEEGACLLCKEELCNGQIKSSGNLRQDNKTEDIEERLDGTFNNFDSEEKYNNQTSILNNDTRNLEQATVNWDPQIFKNNEIRVKQSLAAFETYEDPGLFNNLLDDFDKNFENSLVKRSNVDIPKEVVESYPFTEELVHLVDDDKDKKYINSNEKSGDKIVVTTPEYYDITKSIEGIFNLKESRNKNVKRNIEENDAKDIELAEDKTKDLTNTTDYTEIINEETEIKNIKEKNEKLSQKHNKDELIEDITEKNEHDLINADDNNEIVNEEATKVKSVVKKNSKKIITKHNNEDIKEDATKKNTQEAINTQDENEIMNEKEETMIKNIKRKDAEKITKYNNENDKNFAEDITEKKTHEITNAEDDVDLKNTEINFAKERSEKLSQKDNSEYNAKKDKLIENTFEEEAYEVKDKDEDTVVVNTEIVTKFVKIKGGGKISQKDYSKKKVSMEEENMYKDNKNKETVGKFGKRKNIGKMGHKHNNEDYGKKTNVEEIETQGKEEISENKRVLEKVLGPQKKMESIHFIEEKPNTVLEAENIRKKPVLNVKKRKNKLEVKKITVDNNEVEYDNFKEITTEAEIIKKENVFQKASTTKMKKIPPIWEEKDSDEDVEDGENEGETNKEQNVVPKKKTKENSLKKQFFADDVQIPKKERRKSKKTTATTVDDSNEDQTTEVDNSLEVSFKNENGNEKTKYERFNQYNMKKKARTKSKKGEINPKISKKNDEAEYTEESEKLTKNQLKTSEEPESNKENTTLQPEEEFEESVEKEMVEDHNLEEEEASQNTPTDTPKEELSIKQQKQYLLKKYLKQTGKSEFSFQNDKDLKAKITDVQEKFLESELMNLLDRPDIVKKLEGYQLKDFETLNQFNISEDITSYLSTKEPKSSKNQNENRRKHKKIRKHNRIDELRKKLSKGIRKQYKLTEKELKEIEELVNIEDNEDINTENIEQNNFGNMNDSLGLIQKEEEPIISSNKTLTDTKLFKPMNKWVLVSKFIGRLKEDKDKYVYKYAGERLGSIGSMMQNTYFQENMENGAIRNYYVPIIFVIVVILMI